MHYYLQLTEDCNMRCAYCFLKKTPRKISREKARAALDWIFKFDQEHSQADHLIVSFYGGEALIEFPLLKELTEYAVRKATPGKKLLFGIRTNLTILNARVLAFLKKHHFGLATSIDGNQVTHDAVRKLKNGRGSYKIISRNIPKLLDYLPQAQVNCTISKANVAETHAMVTSLLDAGFKNISFAPNFNDTWTPAEIKTLETALEHLAEDYYQSFQNGAEIAFETFDKPISHFIANQTLLCGGGRAMLAIDIAGNVFPCCYFYNLNDKKTRMGNIFQNAPLTHPVQLARLQKMKACQGCDLQHRCNRFCYGRNLVVTGSFYKPFPLTCEFSKMAIRISDCLATRLFKEKNQAFYKRFYKDWEFGKDNTPRRKKAEAGSASWKATKAHLNTY